jgi:hypothetical protein
MIYLLAQAAADHTDTVITWGVILVLTTIGANIAVIIGTKRSQKREVSFEFTPASKEDFDKHCAHASRMHDLLFDQIRQMNASAALNLRESSERIAGVETQIDLMNQRMVQIDTKLDRLIERKN